VIHIHTAVVWNTIDYAYYMVQNAIDMAADPTKLRFSVYCLDKHAYEFVLSSSAFTELGVTVVPCVQPYTGQGSAQHAAAIDQAISLFDPGVHNAILDGDTVLLRPGWDETIDGLFSTYDMVGVNYEPMLDDHAYQGTPTLAWIVIGKGTDLAGFSAAPAKGEPLVIDYTTAVTYGLPVGSTMIRDTGWQLPKFAHDNGMKVLGLDVVAPTLFSPGDPFLEYHLDGVPFVTHMQRSIRHPFRGDAVSRSFYDDCERFIAAL